MSLPSRNRARLRVEKALAETDPEKVSLAWDAAWSAIRALQSRNLGPDVQIAEKLADQMRGASKRPAPTDQPPAPSHHAAGRD